MDGRHHVLLIGIDAYDGGGMLTGCVNDIDAIQRVLIDRVGIAPDRITRLAAPRTGTVHETDVPEAPPTLDKIRAEFTRLGSEEVGAGDSVFIYYSGHGTQCIVAESTGRRFSREALLPKDKVRGIQRRFLFDWELNALIARIAERTPGSHRGPRLLLVSRRDARGLRGRERRRTGSCRPRRSTACCPTSPGPRMRSVGWPSRSAGWRAATWSRRAATMNGLASRWAKPTTPTAN